MLAMPALSKPVLYNGTIAGMPNKTHEGIFSRYNAQERDRLQWCKKSLKILFKKPQTQNQPKNDNKNP